MKWSNDLLMSSYTAEQYLKSLTESDGVDFSPDFETIPLESRDAIQQLAESVNPLADRLTRTSKPEERWNVDCAVGAELFRALSFDLTKPEDRPLFHWSFDARPESNRFWIGLQMNFFAKLAFRRWDRAAERKNIGDRFVDPSRIWMKTLWWIYFIVWQGGPDDFSNIARFNRVLTDTRRRIEDFGSNAVSQILERAGQGFDLSLLRYLFKNTEGYMMRMGLRSSSEFVSTIMKLDVANKYTSGSGVSEAYVYWNRVLSSVGL